MTPCGWCQACETHMTRPRAFADIETIRYIVCVTCGNKRCPHATDCRLACTNSNDWNQPGSSYQSYVSPPSR